MTGQILCSTEGTVTTDNYQAFQTHTAAHFSSFPHALFRCEFLRPCRSQNGTTPLNNI